MTVVVGIDPGSAGLHAAMIDVEKDTLLLSRVREMSSRPVLHLRSGILNFLFREATILMSTIPREKPIFVFIEEPMVAGGRQSSLKLAQAVGAIVAGVTVYTDKCYLVPVAKWKKETVGNGGASKQQVALWLSRHYPAYSAQCDGSQDLTDACCIARYGIRVVTDSALVRTIGSSG